MSSATQNVAVSEPAGNACRNSCKQLGLLLLLTAVTRLIWLFCAARAQSVSIDLEDWRRVAAALAGGVNPYQKTGFLNWPPFWMQSIALLSKIAGHWHISFYTCVRIFLLIGDMGLLCAVWWLLRLLDPTAPVMRLLIVGYCLNPLLAILTVQHCNFDAYAMIWVVLFLGFLVKYRRGGSDQDWLWAAGCLGMGIYTKTFPLLLGPLLAPGSKKMDRRTRWLGVAMVIGPAALALAPLFALSPAEIEGNVIGYRSMGDTFGFLSLFRLGGLEVNFEVYRQVFGLVAIGGLMALAISLRRRDWPRDEDLPLMCGLIFLAAFTLGTGYGSQYWFWVFPLFLISFRNQRGWFRHALWIAGAVTVATNVYEYGVESWLGGFWKWHDPAARMDFSKYLMGSPTAIPLIRLPMTLAAFVVLAGGLAVLIEQRRRGFASRGFPVV